MKHAEFIQNITNNLNPIEIVDMAKYVMVGGLGAGSLIMTGIGMKLYGESVLAVSAGKQALKYSAKIVGK